MHLLVKARGSLTVRRITWEQDVFVNEETSSDFSNEHFSRTEASDVLHDHKSHYKITRQKNGVMIKDYLYKIPTSFSCVQSDHCTYY